MGIKISELTEYDNSIDEDIILIIDTRNSITKKMTKANFFKGIKRNKYSLEIENIVPDNSGITIPAYYKVRN